MSRLKSEPEISQLRTGGRRLARILNVLRKELRPGLTGRQLDQLARQLIAGEGDQPSFLNYRPEGVTKSYPAALCVSINDEIVHGIPDQRPLKEGDVVSLDLGLNHKGLFTDAALTAVVGPATTEIDKLLMVTEQALAEGIARVRPGNTIGDIGFAIETVARNHGYGVVRELGGHGVGHQVHEEPHIPNFGKRGTGAKLKAGMVLAIEPMFTLGSPDVIFMPDEYLVKTADGGIAAHFEHTVLVTDQGPEVLTHLDSAL